MSDDERREMYDNENLSDYDDICEEVVVRAREDEKDGSSKQSDEMDKDKDGDIDGEDLRLSKRKREET